jgi:hypothetical protein
MSWIFLEIAHNIDKLADLPVIVDDLLLLVAILDHLAQSLQPFFLVVWVLQLLADLINWS